MMKSNIWHQCLLGLDIATIIAAFLFQEVAPAVIANFDSPLPTPTRIAFTPTPTVTPPVHPTATQVPASRDTFAIVSFVTSIDLDVALIEVTRHNLSLVSFQREYTIGEQIYVDGYSPNRFHRMYAELVKGYWRSHGAMLADMQQFVLNNGDSPTENSGANKAWNEFSKGIKQENDDFSVLYGCWEHKSCPSVEVTKIHVTGNINAIKDELVRSPIIARVDI